MESYLALVGIAICFCCQQVYGTVYVTDHSQRRVVELRGRAQPCIDHTDSNVVEQMLRSNGARFIQKMSSNDLDALSSSCRDQEQINKRGGFIYPGTRWCGPGNIATSYSDLGPLSDEDRCCRDHDHCPNQLEPGQCRQGICNISPFTRSHCDCDNAFKRCLREVNSDAANTIGTLFFNIVQVTCFKDRRPCPQYMREDSSYTWFCEEWKFEPSGEFNTTLLIHEIPTVTKGYPIPDRPENLQAAQLPPSTIDKNLHSLFEGEPSAEKVMENGKKEKEKDSKIDSKKPKLTPGSVLNSIPDGKTVWRN